MVRRYTTQDGEMLDAIAYRQYGFVDDAFEAIVEANPDVQERKPVLPALVNLDLPDIDRTKAVRMARLWDK